MKQFYGILTMFSIIIIAMFLTGCAKEISRETIVDEVTITSTDYTGSWLQPMKSGKTTIMITHAAQYDVYFEYDGFKFEVDDSDIYDICKGKEGEKIKAEIMIKKYDDGTIKYSISSVYKK